MPESSQERFRLVVEAAPNAIVMVDEAGSVVLVNAQTERLFGYAREELIGQPVEKLIPPRFRKAHSEYRQSFFRDPRTRPMGTGRDLFGLRKDGSEFPVEIGLNPVETENGTMVLSAIVDITERKKGEGMFRLAIESAPNAMVMVDEEGRIVLVNSQTEKLFGWTREDLIGQPVEVLVPERFRAKHPEYRRSFFLDIRARPMGAGRDLFGLRKDGSEFPVEIGLSPIETEGGKLVLSAIVDITERKQGEERFRLVVESAPNAIVVVDAQGKIVLVNTQTERLFGYGRAELIGQPIEILVPERFRPNHPGYRNGFFADPRARPMGVGRDLYGRRKDASEFPVEIGLNPMQTERGPLVLSAIVDITERKKAEEGLREASRRKDDFLAMLAHELRNPLAPIRNSVQILQTLGPKDPTLGWARDVIDRQVMHMTRLIDDLLDVSRITKGKIQLRKERVDLATVVAAAVEASRPQIEAGGHELTVAMPPGAVILDADPTRLLQVIGNLLDNAAKYTEKGGRISLAVTIAESDAVIEIRDSGVGIPPSLLPHIFDLFTQADRSLDRSKGGLGIGLTLARSLVEMHGGTITAESEGHGMGSRFIIRLPVAGGPDVERQEKKPRRASPATSARARRVLVVEDNVDSAESLERLLQLKGHTVSTVHDGLAAVESARSFRPDIVLLDIGLPGLDGFEVARRLRSQARLEKAVLVALTGYGQEEDRARSREAGFDHHLTKPIDPAVLADLIADGGITRESGDTGSSLR